MYHVYFLRSQKDPSKHYIGYTVDIDQRLEDHNSGASLYTKIDKPWELVLLMTFKDKSRAVLFEKYLKSGSGIAFAKKRLW